MKDQMYVRSIVFGITDSLVSTVGLLAGIDVAGAPHSTLVLTGLVYAFVEAFSMAVGNFLSEESAEEYAAQAEVGNRGPLSSGLVMFVSFILAAFIPLAPYLFLTDWKALVASIIAALATLFVAGMVSGRLAKLPMLTRGLRMLLLGGSAIVIGALVGSFVTVG